MDFMHLSRFKISNEMLSIFSHLGHGFHFFFPSIFFSLFVTLPAHNLHYKYFLHVIRFCFSFIVLRECIKTPLPVWHAIWDFSAAFIWYCCCCVHSVHFFKIQLSTQLMQYLLKRHWHRFSEPYAYSCIQQCSSS